MKIYCYSLVVCVIIVMIGTAIMLFVPGVKLIKKEPLVRENIEFRIQPRTITLDKEVELKPDDHLGWRSNSAGDIQSLFIVSKSRTNEIWRAK